MIMNPSPLRSFWMGGFEGADHLNAAGEPLDMADATAHLDLLNGDYLRARTHGICSVRESLGWRLAETTPHRPDFTRACHIARTAQRHGVQVVWSFMHYGTPPDLSLHDDALIDRFASFAGAAAAALAPFNDTPPVYNLINEISFLSWAVCETNLMHPYRGDPAGRGESTAASGWTVKRRLVQAVLAGIEAVRRVDPRARFLHVEPMVHVVAPRDQPELAALAAQVAGYQWQVWDLLRGTLDPACGGHPEAIDLVGLNHYHSGQWEVGTERRLHWHEGDPRRRPLSSLLQEAWQRYGRPLVLAETSHVGVGRAQWLNETAAEVHAALQAGVPVLGLCLYPLIDRFDWDRPTHWHHSGLWDVDHAAPHPRDRHLVTPYAVALRDWQGRLPLRLAPLLSHSPPVSHRSTELPCLT